VFERWQNIGSAHGLVGHFDRVEVTANWILYRSAFTCPTISIFLNVPFHL